MKVFITGGAGIVGSTTAYYLATQSIADEIVLQDLNDNAVASHAMDMSQCTFLTSPSRVRAGSWADAEGADVVVVAAGVPAALATHDARKDIRAMKQLIETISENVRRYCPNAVVLSLTNPLDAFNYTLWHESGLRREQVIAMSVNDSLRFRFGLARHLGIEPARVDAMVIGMHDPSKLPLYSTVTVDGEPVSFSEDEQAAINCEIGAWWNEFLAVSGNRTASWTTASSCARTIEHIAGRRSGPICCSVLLEDGLSIGYPVYLDRNGVSGVFELKLSDSEAERFEAAKAAAKQSIAEVLAYYHS